jgi:hypothetical protein
MTDIHNKVSIQYLRKYITTNYYTINFCMQFTISQGHFTFNYGDNNHVVISLQTCHFKQFAFASTNPAGLLQKATIASSRT